MTQCMYQNLEFKDSKCDIMVRDALVWLYNLIRRSFCGDHAWC